MSPSTSSSYSILFQDLVGDFYSRRLLLNAPIQQSHSIPSSPPPSINHHDSSEPYNPADNSFDSNVVMVLSVLLCALICSLGLNSIIRCALRCSTLVSSDSSGNSSVRVANTGVKRKALKTFPVVSYSSDLKLPGLDAVCVICLAEFAVGEKVRLLPRCNHGFHVRCIDKWLSSHSSCPTCRHCLIETCQKIVGCNQATSSEPSQQIQVTIAPLEPEGLIHNYREVS